MNLLRSAYSAVSPSDDRLSPRSPHPRLRACDVAARPPGIAVLLFSRNAALLLGSREWLTDPSSAVDQGARDVPVAAANWSTEVGSGAVFPAHLAQSKRPGLTGG